jgi:hypothetical protein
MTGMRNKPILSKGIVGGDNFILFCTKTSDKKITDYLPLFNFDDYYCYKGTNTIREVNYEDILKFTYSTYSFFKKSTYNKEYLDDWVKFCHVNAGGLGLMCNLPLAPFPPFFPNKIIVKQKSNFKPRQYETKS